MSGGALFFLGFAWVFIITGVFVTMSSLVKHQTK
ncbi:conserved hypothetical protein [Thermosediminibacter oceani DSM 16646]|uniref:Uncharacterized protein n=1 Tax=Thermosediminibacter oceani (strain ATCC BAA-1034 / DSM 16646 / JW/IW-1228P) TaxID=555079 RepID=D9RY79_THEOJ|nr:conserved hypothetical protein [Thermosediminibacter oceani DSM 16646]